MTVKEGGFGVPNVNTFWKAIRISWLRRSIGSESTWVKLHQQEVFPYAFGPIESNFESLNKAKAKCRNPFWKKIYCSLIDCRLNILLDHPAEYKYIPINREPFITGNSIPVRQEWAPYKCLNSIIDRKGNLRRINEINSRKNHLSMSIMS